MTRKHYLWALLGGFIGSGVVIALLASGKKQQLEGYVEQVKRLASSGGFAQDALQQQLLQMKQEISSDANSYADVVAKQAAEDYMGATFGLTPARMTKIARLASRIA